jgi:hypothetical protein
MRMDWTPGGEMEVGALKRQVTTLRRQVNAMEERLDTVCSPLYKRLWWVMCGFRFHRVGRWWPSDKYPDLH